jgi:erythronate-4-phosphate dehydrogenase
VLDVWEGEPAIDPSLCDLAAIATPHIAGHSLDGKLRGTHRIYRALAQHLGLPAPVALDDLLPLPPVACLALNGELEDEEALRRCARAVHDVRRDHDSLIREQRRRGLAAGFDHCRAHYPLRREFSTLAVALQEGAQGLSPLLASAGFEVMRDWGGAKGTKKR